MVDVELFFFIHSVLRVCVSSRPHKSFPSSCPTFERDSCASVDPITAKGREVTDTEGK